MKKILSFKALIIFLLAVIIALTSALVITNKKYQNELSKRADSNIFNWSNLHLVSTRTDLFSTDIEAFRLWYNRAIYNIGELYPRYITSGDQMWEFLRNYFDPFLQDIATDNTTGEESKEANKLFLEINEELKNLCSDILKENENNPKAKIELLNSKSDLSKEYTEKIAKFTEKNIEKIKNFKF